MRLMLLVVILSMAYDGVNLRTMSYENSDK